MTPGGVCTACQEPNVKARDGEGIKGEEGRMVVNGLRSGVRQTRYATSIA
jgi:hypothetical protein